MKPFLNNFSVTKNDTIICDKTVDFLTFKNLNDIHFIGFGGAGSNIVEYLYSEKIVGSFTCITNPIRPNIATQIDFINFRPDPKISNQQLPFEIISLFDQSKKYVLLVGLGGLTGTFLAEKIAQLLKYKQIEFLIIASTPFKFEDISRHQLTASFLKDFQNCENLLVYTFAEIKSLQNKPMSFNSVFKTTNELIVQFIDSNF